MNLVFTDPPVVLTPEIVERICRLPGLEVEQYSEFAADEAELSERGKDADIIVTDLSQYKTVLRKWPKLRAIITTSVGTDHIDTEYCAQRGIKVVNFPGYNARGVAEMAFAILISLLRKVPMANNYARGGGWDFQYFEGDELAGKTIGIIGAGNIGRELINIGHGFEMNVVAYTKNPSVERAKQLGLQKFWGFNEVLAKADFLVVAVPASNDTEHMIGSSALSRMKPDAILVNVGRGVVVDTLAVAEALYEKKLAGAALDVIEGEPFNISKADPRIQEMVNSNNVVITPHIGGITKESADRLGERLMIELEALLAPRSLEL